MKFESQFGLREIVCTKQALRGERCRHDLLLEVIGITFQMDGNQAIICRLPDGNVQAFMPTELINDSDFNQETGAYPPERKTKS